MNKNPLDTGNTTPIYAPGRAPFNNLSPSMTQPITPMTKNSGSGFGDSIHSIGSGLDDLSHLETQALTGIAGYYGMKKGLSALGGLANRIMPQAFQDVLVPLEEAGIEMAPIVAALA